ncbi:hypothetical protein E4631_15670 [Hymenobacter sp. UV11]|uniref:hypothetical protein n=1 Tax=Hymenobacter sp. UV11 TaxID=1849735 RepID=UPI00105F1E89|nr:hypothetical protein [Hymenobacter sp. UV11]TDN39264.1 hypothetical protein A8B98_18570 [Hymenobacter sp. UV11]TFZ65656.1 hypothetical protein E4631_15670 [Hymenobacter sp. UV11]
MMLSQFRRFSPVVQLYWVLKYGTFLAQRWETEGGVNLYHLPNEGRGLFVEVGYEEYEQRAVVLRSFSSSVPLEDYGHGVQLPKF